MNKAFRILLAVLLVQLSLQASAQEKKDLFNPVNYAVVSQTIAPDARGGGLGDVGAAPDPDVNSQYGTPPNILSVSRVQEWRSTSHLGFARWSTI